MLKPVAGNQQNQRSGLMYVTLLSLVEEPKVEVTASEFGKPEVPANMTDYLLRTYSTQYNIICGPADLAAFIEKHSRCPRARVSPRRGTRGLPQQ